ncbi:hypothetical protein C2G38_2202667 [Gigaspora rosea]|uniref:PAS domain-containing protein n=1 Tax=Gigaspora rosea TaxID=44941 RepID=A0A397UNC3_9GLOM|nr:hypothetical protein C2G38_2202667 [Gigaspora rosea]
MTWNNNRKQFKEIWPEKYDAYMSLDFNKLECDGYDEEVYFSNTFSPIFKSDGTVGGLFCIAQETTQKVLTTQRLKLLGHLTSS